MTTETPTAADVTDVTTEPTDIAIAHAPVEMGILNATTAAGMVESVSEIATALAGVIEKAQLFSMISGRKYVKAEGWTTLAAMMGLMPREVSCDEQEGGYYIATVELVRMRDGAVVSRASSECGRERPWDKRDHFARRSMAITRATGKVCRIALSWVMPLAGYAPTPAEEMPAPDGGDASDNADPRTPLVPRFGATWDEYVAASTVGGLPSWLRARIAASMSPWAVALLDDERGKKIRGRMRKVFPSVCKSHGIALPLTAEGFGRLGEIVDDETGKPKHPCLQRMAVVLAVKDHEKAQHKAEADAVGGTEAE